MLCHLSELHYINFAKVVICNPKLYNRHKDYFEIGIPNIRRIYKLITIFDDNLPLYPYKLLDNRFANTNIVTWFSLDNPPDWAINLKIVTKEKCLMILNNYDKLK